MAATPPPGYAQWAGAQHAPAGVMVILVVYCLHGLPVTEVRAVAPLTALAVTVGLHLWRRNALLSILGGTATHVILASTIFAP
ncbi:AzlD domain-containing protein [Nonomuraea ceibae]|uniref:AzlD domain-containing protein n=1 Tax=Nonomuraea ceibae TaxID=1935170 RepID=UPI001C5FC3D6|nr:AzlD domain-containing protein [Nonomuraea ceibae]